MGFPYKVYSADGEFLAAAKRVEEAAAVVALLGDGATIRTGQAVRTAVWTEGADGTAGDSYDLVALTVAGRMGDSD